MGLARLRKGWLKRAADFASIDFPHRDSREGKLVNNACGDIYQGCQKHAKELHWTILERQQLSNLTSFGYPAVASALCPRISIDAAPSLPAGC